MKRESKSTLPSATAEDGVVTAASTMSTWKQRKIALALSTLFLLLLLGNRGLGPTPGVLRRPPPRQQLQYGERDTSPAEQVLLRGAGHRERLWSAAIAALKAPPKRAPRNVGTRANAQRLAEASRPALSFVVFIRDRFELLVNCSRASLGHRRSGDNCSHVTMADLEAYRAATGAAIVPLAAAGLTAQEYDAAQGGGEAGSARSWIVLKVALFSNLIDSMWEHLLPGEEWELAICDLGSTDVDVKMELDTTFARKRAEWKEWMASERVAMLDAGRKAGATKQEIATHFVLPATPNIRLAYAREEDDGRPFSRGAGRNCAAALASGEVLFFVDADMRFASRAPIERALAVAASGRHKKRKKKGKAFVPIVKSFHGPLHQRTYKRQHGTGNMAISHDVYDALKLEWIGRTRWGKEDDVMFKRLRNRLGKRNVVRESTPTFIHQWHPNSNAYKNRHVQE